MQGWREWGGGRHAGLWHGRCCGVHPEASGHDDDAALPARLPLLLLLTLRRMCSVPSMLISVPAYLEYTTRSPACTVGGEGGSQQLILRQALRQHARPCKARSALQSPNLGPRGPANHFQRSWFAQ